MEAQPFLTNGFKPQNRWDYGIWSSTLRQPNLHPWCLLMPVRTQRTEAYRQETFDLPKIHMMVKKYNVISFQCQPFWGTHLGLGSSQARNCSVMAKWDQMGEMLSSQRKIRIRISGTKTQRCGRGTFSQSALSGNNFAYDHCLCPYLCFSRCVLFYSERKAIITAVWDIRLFPTLRKILWTEKHLLCLKYHVSFFFLEKGVGGSRSTQSVLIALSKSNIEVACNPLRSDRVHWNQKGK